MDTHDMFFSSHLILTVYCVRFAGVLGETVSLGSSCGARLLFRSFCISLADRNRPSFSPTSGLLLKIQSLMGHAGSDRGN